jgi:ABC-type transport system substrate-binding protein
LRCCSSSTPSFCSSSEPRGPVARALTVLALAGALLPGCGDTADQRADQSTEAAPAPAGDLRIAVSAPIETLDPLLADSRAERLAARQVHEPLVSFQNGPFGSSRRRPGLARAVKPSAGDTIWTAYLRPGVRFQNGEPFDAEAVRANSERWRTVSPGPELLPGLVAVDYPRPGRVRFILDRPDPRFGRRLADPRLGLVAPSALPTIASAPVKLGSTGTGPFELREQDGPATLLARNVGWWGADLGLGPGVEQVELVDVPSPGSRGDGLLDGGFDVADALDRRTAKRIAADPLLTVIGGGAGVLGMSRAVRGLESADAAQPLADAWLTRLR